jgi:SpoIVB peptidase S55
VLALTLCAALASAAAAIPPDPQAKGPAAVEDPPILPLSAVKVGMKGTGYTVFSSVRGPEPFQFEVLGVMTSYLGPGEDLIIARLFGGEIEKTGVISGMSGSPAYVDGKLIGAVGYRFGSFTKDPIAGITPIERMLETAAPPAARPAKNVATAWGQGEPIAVPLTVSGVPAHVLEGFRGELEARGYAMVAQGGGAGGSKAPSKPVRFYAGGPISGNLVDGDVSLGATGTVTWVKGDRFLAFGHPFMGEGRSEIPVGNAHIVTTVASEAGSWKMGQGLNTFGRLTDDRLHAIAGTIGSLPPRVHVELALDADSPRASSDAQKKFTFEVMQHETDTPLFCAMAVAAALGNRVGAERGGTVDLALEAKLSNGAVLPATFRASDVGMGYDMPVAFAVLGMLSAAVDQDFEKVTIVSVNARVKVRAQVERARVAAVDAPVALVAGKRADVRVRLASFRGAKLEERRVTVSLPRGLPPGGYTLIVTGSAEAARVEREMGAVPFALTYARYLENIKALPPPGALSVYLVRDDLSLRLEGQTLAGLPPSLEGLLADGGGLSGQVVEARGVRLSRSVGTGVVFGEAQARVMVRSADDEAGE